MLALTRAKGSAVRVHHRGAVLRLEFKQSLSHSILLEFTGHLAAFEIESKTLRDSPRGMVANLNRNQTLRIYCENESFEVKLTRLTPNRASFAFEASKEFIINREEVDALP